MGPDSVVVQTAGDVADSAREYARRQIAAFVRRFRTRLTGLSPYARVKLTVFSRPSVRLPALVQANLDVGGQPVRAQTAAAFVQEASRRLRARLEQQVARLSHPETPRPWSGAARPDWEPMTVPVGRREIVRHKSCPLARCTPDRAALTMDVMDYDCYLFVDTGTGCDSLVYRVGPTGYRLSRLAAAPPPESVVPMTLDPHPVPELTAAEAVARLDATEMPYRFFRDRDSGRGAVLYRRFDGHYGLITPSGS